MRGAIIIEGHVQGLAITRALGEAGIPVIVIDKSNCIARFSRYCDKFFYCPDFKSEKFVDFLLDLAADEKLDGWVLIPSNDHAVFSISANKARIEKYFKTTVPDLNTFEKIYNKARLIQLAEQLHVPIPRTWYFTNPGKIDNQLSWPIITKGKMGLDFYKTFKRKAFLAYNTTELQKQLYQIKNDFPLENTFSQELIPSDGSNRTISFTSFSIDGIIKTFWIGEKIREHPVRFGTATLTRSIYVKACQDHSIKLLRALQYTGVCELEYLKNPRDGEYKLIEINARTWLWVGHAIACGVNYPLYIYNYLNNRLNIFPQKYETGVKWINYLTDTFIVIKMLKSKTISLKQLFESYKGKKVRAIFSWKDIKPGIALLIMSFYLARKREIV